MVPNQRRKHRRVSTMQKLIADDIHVLPHTHLYAFHRVRIGAFLPVKTTRIRNMLIRPSSDIPPYSSTSLTMWESRVVMLR